MDRQPAQRDSYLVLEFTGVDDERTFNTLLPDVPPGQVVKVDPLAAHFHQSVPVTRQAEMICDQLTGPAQLIFGYCSGAALALRIAAELHDRGVDAPHVLLLNPDVIDDETMRREFTGMYTGVGGDPTEVLATLVGQTGEELVDNLQKALFDRQDALIEAYGGPEAAEPVRYLFNRYRAWLAFLAVTGRAPVVDPHSPVSVITGQEHGDVDLAALLSAPGSARIHRCAAPDRTLLASPEAREAVAAIIRIVG